MSVPGDTMGLTKEDVVSVIQKTLKNDDFSVKEFSLSPANTQVSGFMGAHRRLFVTVLLHGREEKFQYFVKSLPEQEGQKNVAVDIGLFEKEVGFYTQILPDLSELGVPLPYAECYLARSNGVNDFLVLEDLSQSGHRLFDRKLSLDFEHCVLVFRALAKLHSASAVAERLKGTPLIQLYPFLKEIVFTPDAGKLVKDMFEKSMETVLQLAKLVPKPQDSISKYEAKKATFFPHAQEMMKPWDILNVVCHGDLWINNMMFTYNNATPTSVKLLDLQIPRYGPPTLDIILFLFVSTTRQFRAKHDLELLKIYYDAFHNTAHQLGTNFQQFTFEELLGNYKSKKLLGCIYQVFYLPFVLMDESQAEKIVDPSEDDGFQSFFTDKQTAAVCKYFKRNAEYRERLTEAIDELFEELKV